MRILGDFRGPKQAPGPSQGVQGGTKEAPGRHRGGTEEAPGRHQGGTKEAPRKDLHIDMGPRAHHFQRIELRTSSGRSISFDLTRSGHKARRILLVLFLGSVGGKLECGVVLD